MKTGIIRRIDDLGRIVIPKELRRELHIMENDPFEIGIEGGKIVLEKYSPSREYVREITALIDDIETDTFLNKKEHHNKALAALKEARDALKGEGR